MKFISYYTSMSEKLPLLKIPTHLPSSVTDEDVDDIIVDILRDAIKRFKEQEKKKPH